MKKILLIALFCVAGSSEAGILKSVVHGAAIGTGATIASSVVRSTMKEKDKEKEKATLKDAQNSPASDQLQGKPGTASTPNYGTVPGQK